jgi:hypothetical protein
MRVRRRHGHRRQGSANVFELAERTLHDIAEETRRIFPNG